MSLVSSAAVLAAIASLSLGGCVGPVQRRAEPLSPARMYQLCNDVQFQCMPAQLQTPGMEPAAPQVDTNLTAPARASKLG